MVRGEIVAFFRKNLWGENCHTLGLLGEKEMARGGVHQKAGERHEQGVKKGRTQRG